VAEFQTAGYRFVYDSRRSNDTSASAEARLANLTAAIDNLEAALGRSGGPFFCGSSLSIADCTAAPFLERYRYQLPLVSADAPRLYSPAQRPALAAWYDAMDAEPAFTRRASGDAYSWAAVLSAMARFGLPVGAEPAPERRAEADRADRAAASILDSLAADAAAGAFSTTAEARCEAARAVAANRDAVIEDSVRAAPLSQAHLPRLPDTPPARRAADAALRAAVQALLAPTAAPWAAAAEAAAAVRAEGDVDSRLAAEAARVVAARLSVPRDMGAAAGAALRVVLLGVAAALDRA
jgi:glutathione S-transferase